MSVLKLQTGDATTIINRKAIRKTQNITEFLRTLKEIPLGGNLGQHFELNLGYICLLTTAYSKRRENTTKTHRYE